MKITVAIDSFKGSLSSLEAGHAASAGILRAIPDARVSVRPLADGGEGTVRALTAAMGGKFRTLEVSGPLGEPVISEYGILDLNGRQTAVIEAASAAGLALVPPTLRSPMVTTTFGVGQMIRDAIHRGCRYFLIGIGGSATNDGGCGMLAALGYEFWDQDGCPIVSGARGLSHLASISDAHALPELAQCHFRIACDIQNPLTGASGCSAIFGPQKGASPEQVLQMDAWMKNYDRTAKKIRPEADPDFPGSGAAGGLGYAFHTFLNASLEPGAAIILEETKLKDNIRDADLVVTGEGRLDGQTIMGKAPIAVARLAKQFHKPVIALAGCVNPDADLCNQNGIDAFFPILHHPCSLEEALEPHNARANLEAAAEQVFRLIQTARTLS